jgi:hypothetical protein
LPEEEEATLIKSRGPHLAGEEKNNTRYQKGKKKKGKKIKCQGWSLVMFDPTSHKT